jgi:phytoene desaturase
VKPRNIIVLGAGISGLATASLLAKAGHKVKVIEGASWIGGKSKRIVVDGQRMDTGPALVTFPGVWEEFIRSYDNLGIWSKGKRDCTNSFRTTFRSRGVLLPGR